MDGRKNNGGHSTKGKAGRKPKAEELKLIEQLDKIIDREEVIQKLKVMIDDGNFKAVQLYMNYMYGRPKETKDITINAEQPLFNLD
jgi:hypothetical protein